MIPMDLGRCEEGIKVHYPIPAKKTSHLRSDVPVAAGSGPQQGYVVRFLETRARAQLWRS